MKTRILMMAALAACVTTALAQKLPGLPEENGLTPKSDTIYINRVTADITTINNNKTESLGVAIANGGNVIVGWEDDNDGLADLEAVWTMFDSAGLSITPDTKLTGVVSPGESITSKFLSYFRADGSAVAGYSSWGPKIHANLFGDGIGMGATSFALGEEVAAFAGYDDQNMGDFPSVQLLDNTGQPLKILAGVSQAYATRDAESIRIADWEYLSNGNIVIVGESRQNQDLVDVYSGTDAFRHVIFRIVDPAGNVVKAESLVSETPNQAANAEMWHGVGVTKNEFAVRFKADNNRATVRMFDNSGNPTSTNLDIGTLAGHEEANGGGRGDGAGFHGNGNDAYVAVAGSGASVWVTVLNTNGTVRYSKSVADDLTLASVGRADAAIDADGKVVVVFSGKYDAASPELVMGRRFDAAGKPVGGTFYVSEKEVPGAAAGASAGARGLPGAAARWPSSGRATTTRKPLTPPRDRP